MDSPQHPLTAFLFTKINESHRRHISCNMVPETDSKPIIIIIIIIITYMPSCYIYMVF